MTPYITTEDLLPKTPMLPARLGVVGPYPGLQGVSLRDRLLRQPANLPLSLWQPPSNVFHADHALPSPKETGGRIRKEELESYLQQTATALKSKLKNGYHAKNLLKYQKKVEQSLFLSSRLNHSIHDHTMAETRDPLLEVDGGKCLHALASRSSITHLSTHSPVLTHMDPAIAHLQDEKLPANLSFRLNRTWEDLHHNVGGDKLPSAKGTGRLCFFKAETPRCHLHKEVIDMCTANYKKRQDWLADHLKVPGLTALRNEIKPLMDQDAHHVIGSPSGMGAERSGRYNSDVHIPRKGYSTKLSRTCALFNSIRKGDVPAVVDLQSIPITSRSQTAWSFVEASGVDPQNSVRFLERAVFLENDKINSRKVKNGVHAVYRQNPFSYKNFLKRDLPSEKKKHSGLRH